MRSGGKTSQLWSNSILLRTTGKPKEKKLKDIIGIANSKPAYTLVLNHLPEALHYEEVSGEMKAQDLLRQSLKAEQNEYRILHVLVMTELFHITESTTTATLAPVSKDVFRCEFFRSVLSHMQYI